MVRVTRPIFSFGSHIPEWLKRGSPNFICRLNISSASLGMTDSPNWRGQGHMTRFLNFALPNHIFGIGKARHFIFRALIDTQEY